MATPRTCKGRTPGAAGAGGSRIPRGLALPTGGSLGQNSEGSPSEFFDHSPGPNTKEMKNTKMPLMNPHAYIPTISKSPYRLTIDTPLQASNYSPGCVWGPMETLSGCFKFFLLRIGEELKWMFQVTVRDEARAACFVNRTAVWR